MKLYFMEGPEAGKTYEFESDVIYLGRSPDSDIRTKRNCGMILTQQDNRSPKALFTRLLTKIGL